MIYFIKIEAFGSKNEDFDQTYVNTGSKTQNVEELSLDLIVHTLKSLINEQGGYVLFLVLSKYSFIRNFRVIISGKLSKVFAHKAQN